MYKLFISIVILFMLYCSSPYMTSSSMRLYKNGKLSDSIIEFELYEARQDSINNISELKEVCPNDFDWVWSTEQNKWLKKCIKFNGR